VPVAVEQGRLLDLLGVQVWDPSDHQSSFNPFGDLPGTERDEGHLGDLGLRDPPARDLVTDRVRVLDRLPPVLGDRRDRRLHRGVHPNGDGHVRAGLDRGADGGVAVERGVRPQQRPNTAAQVHAAKRGEGVGDDPGRAFRGTGLPLPQPLGEDHRR